MNELALVFVAIAGLIFYALHLLSRKQAQLIRQHGFHTCAIVRYYKTEYVRVAGSWTWLEYPYVEYMSEAGELIPCRLKYASSSGPLLAIGEEVDVVLHDSVLYYAPTLVPGTWKDMPVYLKKLLWLLVLAAVPSPFTAPL